MTVESFLELARTRRAVRDFAPDPVPEATLEKILEAGRAAPSGYNLQPTQVVVVTEAALRARLAEACLDQRQVAEAPVVLVLAGDRAVFRENLEEVLRMDAAAGAIDAAYARKMRRVVPLAFGTGPLGLGWLAKAVGLPLLRGFLRIPCLPAVHRRAWLGKQAGLFAMNVLLAAEAAGLGACPMEGFSDRAVRRAVGLPGRLLPLIVIPLGRALARPAAKSRFPRERFVHRERYAAR